jgi:4-azaleucine resistance transporter AzlC
LTDPQSCPATWRAGFRAGLPLTLGVAPFAVAFGLSAREAGFGVLGIGAMSVFVMAGSAQFLAVAMLKAGASVPQIWLATLFLNSRHLLMSIALLPRLADRPIWQRAILAHMVVDEVFAVVSREPRGGAAYLLGAETAICGAWVVGTLVGATLGADLPPALTEAAGFSLLGFFVAVVASSARGLPGWATAVVSAILALGLSPLVPRGWDLLVAGAGAATVGAILYARTGKDEAA